MKARLKGLLALVLSMSIFLGVSMSVMAAEYAPGSISVNDRVNGGDTIGWLSSGGARIIYQLPDGTTRTPAGSTPEICAGNGGTYYKSNTIAAAESGYTGWYVISKTPDGETEGGGSCFSITLAPYPVRAQAAVETGYVDGGCNHNFEMAVILEPTMETSGYEQLKCTICGDLTGPAIMIPGSGAYVEMIVKAIQNAKQGATISLNTFTWLTLNQKIVDALAARPDVSITFNYIYDNKNYTVTVPAGANLTALLDENGYIGFRRLDAEFGGSEIIK